VATKKFTINDTDRADWVENDEGLYGWFRRSRMSMRQFVRENRAGIDMRIHEVRGGKEEERYPLGYMQGRRAS
jgi:hypothetical protein